MSRGETRGVRGNERAGLTVEETLTTVEGNPKIVAGQYRTLTSVGFACGFVTTTNRFAPLPKWLDEQNEGKPVRLVGIRKATQFRIAAVTLVESRGLESSSPEKTNCQPANAGVMAP